jgi:hypothetical protein
VCGIAVTLAYNRVRFGSVLDFGYHEEGFSGSLWSGLYGFVLSPGRSVFVYSPVLILVLFGLVPLWRRCRAESAMLLGAAAVITLCYAKWHNWPGGWAWGPRFLVPVVPLLMVFTAEAWQSALSRTGVLIRGALVLLVLVAVLVQIPGVAVNPMTYYRIVYEQPASMKAKRMVEDSISFTPNFTPLAASVWLMKWSIIRAARSMSLEMKEVYDDSPWASNRPEWRPAFSEQYLTLDQWYLRADRTAPGISKAVVIGYLVIAVLGMVVSAVFAGTMCRKKRRGESDRLDSPRP